jgi:hypothetical protein
VLSLRERHSGVSKSAALFRERDMGKYFIGWLFGVPVFVLVLIYLFMH